MSNPLPYDVCCKLRDAGFPQDGDGWRYRTKPGQPDYVRRAYFGKGYLNTADFTVNVACPDLESMLEWAQARWPKYIFKLAVGTANLEPGDPPCCAYCYVPGDSTETSRTDYGDTPAAAVAALLLRLAEVEG